MREGGRRGVELFFFRASKFQTLKQSRSGISDTIINPRFVDLLFKLVSEFSHIHI